MPLLRTCIRCGAAPAHRVESALALWNVAEEEMPTGIILDADSCEKCQVAVVKTLQKHNILTLQEQAPIHKQMVALAKERDLAESALNEHSRLVRADYEQATASATTHNAKLATGKPALSPESFMTTEITERHAKLAARARDLEAERASHAERGTALDAKRKAALLKDLKKK